MQRALVVVALVTTSCLPFANTLDELCRSGTFTDCADAGAADGGSTGGGSGGGGSTDGGAGGGMTAGCFGNDGWCWEYPRPFGAALYAIWGSSDSDVWVAGGGQLVAQWTGSQWVNQTPTLPPQALLDEQRAFAQVVTTDAGTWLRDTTGAVWQRTPSNRFLSVATGIDAIASVEDQVVLANSTGFHSPDGGLRGNLGLPPNFHLESLAFASSDAGRWCAFTGYDNGPNRYARACADAGVLLTLSRPSPVFPVPGGLAVAETPLLYSLANDGSWHDAGLPWDPTTTALGGLSSSTTTWVYGTSGRVTTLSTATESHAGNDLFGGWLSASSTGWFVGVHGTVLQGIPATEVDRGAIWSGGVRAMALDESQQLMFGNGLVLKAVDGHWVPFSAPNFDPCAALSIGGKIFVLRMGVEGSVASLDVSNTSVVVQEVLARLSQPPADYLPHCGDLSPQGDGGFYAGLGSSLVKWDGPGLRTDLTLPWGNRVTAVETVPGGVLVAVNQVDNNADSDGGRVFRFMDGSRAPDLLYSSGVQLYGLLRTHAGEIWVAGENGLLGHLNADGGSFVRALAGAADAPDVVDVYEDSATHRLWALLVNGVVLRQEADGGWAREAPGITPVLQERVGERLGGLPTRLFSVGNQGVLSRALP